jgi:hypothetical protein
MKSLYSAMLAGLFVLLAGSAAAQSEDMKAMAQQFGQSAKQNAMALRMYAWQMRVEITLKGDPKPPKLFAMRFDPDGVVQTALNPAPPAQPTRGLKGRIKEKRSPNSRNGLGISLTCAKAIWPRHPRCSRRSSRRCSPHRPQAALSTSTPKE